MTKHLQRNPRQTRATGPNHSVYRPRPERWFTWRFSLRRLFVVVLVLSIPLSWLAVQVKWIRDRHEALRDRDIFYGGMDGADRIRAPWRIRILGELGVEMIGVRARRNHDPAEKLRLLKHLFPEAEVTMRGP